MGERGRIHCPNCGQDELCIWPGIPHDHRCDKDGLQYPYDGSDVIEYFDPNVW